MKIKLSCLLFIFSSFWLFAQEATSYIIQFEPGKLHFNRSNIVFDSKTRLLETTLLDWKENEFSRGFAVVTFNQPIDQNILDHWSQVNKFKRVIFNAPALTRNTTPNDESYGDLWNLPLIGAPKVWSTATGGKNSKEEDIVIAVIDTDFDINHVDLFENIYSNEAEANGQPNVDDDGNGLIDDINGYDFEDNIGEIFPMGSSHGTQVAGVIGAKGNNNTGLTGLNWNIKILPLRILNLSQYIDAQNIVRSMRLKYNNEDANGAFVVSINASLGFNGLSQNALDLISELYDDLGEVGVLNVGSLPNENINIDTEIDITSAESPYLISVTNTSFNDRKTTNAGFGLNNCDLGAPGGDNLRGITTLINFDDYESNSGGTSFSAPLVAGTVGLLYNQTSNFLDSITAENPAETALFLKDIILNSTTPIEDLQGKSVSGGRLDINQAFLNLHQYYNENIAQISASVIEPLKIINIFPNPIFAGEEIKIIFAHDCFEPLDYSIYDLVGAEIVQGEITPVLLTANQYEGTLSNQLAAGIYVLKLSNGQRFEVSKLVVQ